MKYYKQTSNVLMTRRHRLRGYSSTMWRTVYRCALESYSGVRAFPHLCKLSVYLPLFVCRQFSVVHVLRGSSKPSDRNRPFGAFTVTSNSPSVFSIHFLDRNVPVLRRCPLIMEDLRSAVYSFRYQACHSGWVVGV